MGIAGQPGALQPLGLDGVGVAPLLYLVPALGLLILWEAGKAVVRRADARHGRSAGAGPATPRQSVSSQGPSIPAPRSA